MSFILKQKNNSALTSNPQLRPGMKENGKNTSDSNLNKVISGSAIPKVHSEDSSIGPSGIQTGVTGF